MNGSPMPLPLFAGYGIELEYMIVDRETLDVRPLADELLRAVAGDYVAEVEQGPTAWSNELVLHVIELKTNGPARQLEDLPAAFQADIHRIDELLAPLGARLMPGAMHPWMDPSREARLWPHEYNPIYQAFDRIFGCAGHGWSNLQSTHINLPFADDREFARLHAAIRLVLPILPALAAGSPVVEGRITGVMDSRLEAYRLNARRIPSITGQVVPETVSSRSEYETRILATMYRDIAPHDPDGILRHEWLNARGAIARFERCAIEIRVLDIQESPLADLAIAAASVAVLKALTEERWTSLVHQQTQRTAQLSDIFVACVRDGERAVIRHADFLECFGFSRQRVCTAQELWQHVVEAVAFGLDGNGAPWRPALNVILNHGCLARRLLRALGRDGSKQRIKNVYRTLCDCLVEGRLFLGAN